MQLGLSGTTTNWNILARQPSPVAPDDAVATIADAVWPSAFAISPTDTATRNDNLLVSATQTSANPQTVVYEINSRAVWSDGTRITGADFVYTWQAQSGRRAFRDKGGQLFTPESTAGYARIASVTTSATDPDRVVVTFKHPYADWPSLFSPILPAQVAKRVGFDHGFSDPVTSLVSAGPFEVESYQPGTGIILVRNPTWWGPAANLASVDITFVSSAAEATDGLQQSELDAAVTGLDPFALARDRATTGLVTTVSASATYDDLVANERDGPLGLRALRLAIFATVGRNPIIAAAAGAGDADAAAVDNRAFLPGQAGYANDSSAVTPALSALAAQTSATTTGGGATTLVLARRALAAAGFTTRDDRLRYRHRVVRLTLGVASTTPWAQGETAAVAAACAALHIPLTILRTTSATEASRVAAGRYSLAIVAATVAPFPSALAATYATDGPANVTGYSTPAMDALLARVEATPPGAARTSAVIAADRLAWADGIDLPLVVQPSVLVFQARYLNLAPSPAGIGWNMASWGILEGT
jgi:peptide/nickel transport system substrate-binding protein